MTDKQPEALFFAELLEQAAGDYTAWDKKTGYAAAAELRRLHNENTLKHFAEAVENYKRMAAQRDELLEALKGVIKAEHSEGRGGSGFIPKAPTLEHQQRVYQAWQKAHAAITKVEGEKQ